LALATGIGTHRRRGDLDFPVVDADGHLIEYWPLLSEYIREEGVDATPEALAIGYRTFGPDSIEERSRTRAVQSSWWSLPAENTLDHATAMMPALLRHRLDAIGIDFAVVFPTMGLSFGHVANAELRQAACRGLNRYTADLFAGQRDRIEPAGVIPMGTPGEAVAALDHAVTDLGFKTVLIPSFMERPIEAATTAVGMYPGMGRYATWMDFYGIDSLYDYDPFWARCVELGVSVSGHSFSFGTGTRRSISNYMFNHLGNFAGAGEALCKSLFMGGVTRRFPKLRIALLEGGVSWAAQLYVDLIGHWKKRNGQTIRRYDPDRLDVEMLAELAREYGGPLARFDLGAYRSAGYTDRPTPEHLDEFEACGIQEPADIARLFVHNFAFGCEADDPLVATAFSPLPYDARLNAIFSSDIGHWDVPDMTCVLDEVCEPVDDGWLSLADLRSFVFENPVRFHAAANPDFFRGTCIEKEALSLTGNASTETLVKDGSA
jgi:predicted TIM-barrel fold metal-dependent hydrolase